MNLACAGTGAKRRCIQIGRNVALGAFGFLVINKPNDGQGVAGELGVEGGGWGLKLRKTGTLARRRKEVFTQIAV